MVRSKAKAALLLCLLLSRCEPLEFSNEERWSWDTCENFSASFIEVVKNENRHFEVSIRYTTDQPAETSIYYRPYQSDTYYRSEDTSLGTTHQLTLRLLRPNTEYIFYVANENQGCLAPEPFRFVTHALPSDFSDFHLAIANDYPVDGGFVLSHVRIGQPRYFFMTDESGSIVWYHLIVDRSPKVFSLSDQNTILCMLGEEPSLLEPADQIMEIDLDGNVITHITEIEKKLHHDVIKKNGLYHAITYEEDTFDLRALGGSQQEKILGDGILVLDEEGEKVWEWSVFDVKNPRFDPAIMKRRHDWLHMNSLWLDEDNNYYLSFRNTDGIWKINGTTGDLIWEAYPSQLSGQHSIFIENERLNLFNNGLSTSRSSYEEYPLTPSGQMSEEPSLAVDLPSSYFTYAMGSAYPIEDLVLFCSTINGSLLMTDQHGKVNWMLEGPFFPFRAYFIEQPFPGFREFKK